ncbi:molybdenum cofactor guanylyltransferase MobA [Advenella mimigardefordensis]|uniref:Molybdenum cofactor guanylyltransferase n=1 Tax=Advenella mimigardefordensis (strain DSM 17166 / LMG 22922 / DPN7) TaxID=1247726 RepID=W0PHI7_ADVMD|nr:molybdenum cofactor guanylyltransferase MobA [Advenella mimigardefordensis]AHG64915.1 molybdopterin-guanine dinucleotide biosynthesis protein A [Advenella mimigardefordensis DPN7]
MTAISQPAQLAPREVTALILAGGQGRRLGGVDKGLVQLHDHPLVEYVLRALQPHVAHVLISANQHQEQYRQYGQVVADPPEFDGSQGPLAGLLAAAPHVTTPWLVAAGCDMPALPNDYVTHLYATLIAQGGQIAFAHAGARDHSICLLLHTHTLATLRAYLQGGRRAVLPWLESQQAVRVIFDHAQAFLNVNTPEELALAQASVTPL